MSKRLYVCPLPTTAQQRRSQGQETQRNITSNGILNSDVTAVEPISTGASGTPVDGQYRGQYADVMAAELRELSESSGYGTVPYYDTSGRSAADGYYSIEQLDAQPTTPNTDLVQQYQGRLSKAGTRDSHLRAVTVTPREVTHPFGSDTTAEIAIPAEADSVWWVDATTEQAIPATPDRSVQAELGFLDVYQLADAEPDITGADTVLAYSLPLDAIGPVDVRVWDTRGYDSRDDAEGYVQWQKVFTGTHGYEGAAVISTGRRRLWLDRDAEPGVRLQTQPYDVAGGAFEGPAYGDGAYGDRVYGGYDGAWEDVSLPTSSWTLTDYDIAHGTNQQLGPARVDVRTRWLDRDDGSRYGLDMTVQRGASEVLIYRPPDTDTAIPDGLQTLLDTIASPSVVVPQAAQTIRARDKIDTQQ